MTECVCVYMELIPDEKFKREYFKFNSWPKSGNFQNGYQNDNHS